MFILARQPARLERSIPLLARGTRHRRPKKGVLIRLLEDIPAVGRAGAVLEVPRQMMRAWYFPEHRAEYVVRPRGGFRGEDFAAAVAVEEVVAEPIAQTTTSAPQAPSLALLLPVLQSLPPILFSRRPITPTSQQIYGSVTASNILSRLSADFNLPLPTDPSLCTVDLVGEAVDGGRVKRLGNASARVVLHGVGEAEVRIRVVDMEQAKEQTEQRA
ncbi:hypothetical protein DACRYDRAFT_106685 [Dacryopinax primogenitus]|uniref:Ribosomal protein L9 domain-containing protein n=1 Tax=Dacryopinax primogenitus (strain DJM 731) TaxID=1858805 RepID=M5GDQ5_DACPD|nr:uncharacterized protein DACRYDRAFT_106685 [Dacryopinax primogenitus]EJU02618.1 hypothetical protein DACRYDRAFT_106685 [Dacryopinax primogenitus]